MRAMHYWLIVVVVGMIGLGGLLGDAPSAQAHTEPPTAGDVLECTATMSYGDVMSCAILQVGEVYQVQFTAKAGDIINLRIRRTSGTFIPWVRLTDPQGITVCSENGGYNNYISLTQCVLSTAGVHTIRVGDSTNTRTGSFNMQLQHQTQPVGATPILLGQGMTGVFDFAGQANSYTLTAAAGDIFIFRMSNVSGSIRPAMFLSSSDGSWLCSQAEVYSFAAEIAMCRIPLSGIYTLHVSDYSLERTGVYQLFVQRLFQPVDATQLAVDMTSSATISQTATLHSYQVNVTAGTQLMFRIARTSGDLYPSVRVIGRDGTTLCSTGNWYAQSGEISACRFPLSGTYTIFVNDVRGTQTGSYNLTVQNLSAPSNASQLQIGDTAQVLLPAATSVQAYVLTARAGEVLRIRAASTSGSIRPLIRVMRPDGTSGCTSSRPNTTAAEISACSFALDGTYTLIIGDEDFVRTGSLVLSVQSITHPANATPISANTGVTATLGLAQTHAYLWYGKTGDSLRLVLKQLVGDLRPSIHIYDPAGILICSRDEYSVATIAACLLPREGRYTILAASTPVWGIGTYRLTLTCNNENCGAPIPTATATPQPTATATGLPTDTPLPTATATGVPTDTPLPTATATGLPLENAPILTVASGATNLLLAWTPAPNPQIAHYLVVRRIADSPSVATLGVVNATTFVDSAASLQAGQRYCYRVIPRTSSNQTLPASNEACAEMGVVELWIPDVWARAGDQVIVPVNIRNAHGLRIAATDLWLEFDGSVIQPSGIRSTPLTYNYIWRYAVDVYDVTYRRIKISSIASPAPVLYGNGSLFWLTFTVVGQAGDQSALNLRDYITGIGGSNLYAVGINGDTMAINLRLRAGTLRIAEAQSLGDVDGNGSVGAIDAYLTLQLASGQRTPTPAEQFAADVNGDGRIGAADATMILFYAVHSRWPNPTEQATLSDANPLTLSLAPVTGAAGQHVTTVLALEPRADLAGADLTLIYDPRLIAAITNVQLHTGQDEFALAFHDDGAGQVRLALARAEATSVQGAWFTLTVQLAEDATIGQTGMLALADARLHDGAGRDFATSALQRSLSRTAATVTIAPAQRRMLVHLPLVVRR